MKSTAIAISFLALSLPAFSANPPNPQILEYVIEGERFPTETLETSLKSPELQVSTSGGVGGEQFLSFHGLPSRYSLVLWEGMPLSDPLAPGDSADVSTLGKPLRAHLKARPFGSLYGSRASGGVLDLQWLPRGSSRGVSGGIELGTEGSLSEHIQFQNSGREKGYAFSLRREDSRGISSADARTGATEPDRYSKTEIFSGAYTTLGAAEFTVLARHSERETDFDGSDFTTFLPIDDLGNHASTSHSLVGVKVGVDAFRDLYVSSRLSSGFSRYRSVGQMPLERFAAEHRVQFQGESNGFVLGAEAASVAGEGETALFAHDAFEIENADLNAGLRYEYASNLGTFLADSEVGLQVSKQVRLFTSFGTIARRPTLYERLGPFGNSALQPEIGYGARAGFEFTSGLQTARVGFFASRLYETVAFQGMRYENAGELAPRGIEVQSEWRVGSGSLLASYQYLFKTSAEHRASLTLRGPAEKRFTPEVQLSAVSERRDPFLGSALSAYGLVGGGVTAKLSAVAKLSLRVENLLNTAYQESYGYGTRGTTVWLGVQVAQL